MRVQDVQIIMLSEEGFACPLQVLTDPAVTHVIVGDKREGLQGFQAPKHVKVVEVSHLPSSTMLQHPDLPYVPASAIGWCEARRDEDAKNERDGAYMSM